MAGTFEESMHQTRLDFKNLVAPALRKVFISSKFISNEGKTDELSVAFDTFAGIDIWEIDKDKKKVRGISSRIQRCVEDWRTFTIRHQRDNGKPTEYVKRIVTDGLHPDWFLQAYVTPDGEKLKRLALVRAKDIFDFIRRFKPPLRHTGENQIGQASFFICEWGAMQKKGYKLFVMDGDSVADITDWGFLVKKIFNTDAGGNAENTDDIGQLNFMF